MYHFRIEHNELARRQVVAVIHCLDRNAATQRVNHHESRRPVRWQTGACLEGKQHYSERTLVKDGDLSMPLRALVMLAVKALERGSEIDAVFGAGEALGRRRAEAILRR
jgi:hypothetical protein